MYLVDTIEKQSNQHVTNKKSRSENIKTKQLQMITTTMMMMMTDDPTIFISPLQKTNKTKQQN